MRKFRYALLAGIAALGLAGFPGIAQARGPAMHDMTIQLPGGGVEHIRYSGDVPPQIIQLPVSDPVMVMPDLAAWMQPFSILDRISAAMDAQAMTLLRDVATPGAGHVCTRSIAMTWTGNGAAPQVVSHVSGDCGGAAGRAVAQPARHDAMPHLIRVRADMPAVAPQRIPG